jgi:hypothetical protein
MRKHFFVPLLVLSVILLFASCKKDNGKSKTEYLTQSGWKNVSVLSDMGTGSFVNQPVEDCAKDDILKFEADHSYNTTVGTKCDPSDNNETGSWALSADEKTLILNGDDVSIETLNGSTLVITESETFGGVTFRYKATFGH